MPESFEKPRKGGVAIPAAAAGATRVVAEDAGEAVSQAADAVADDASAAAPATPFGSMKGLLDMATTFDTAAFTPGAEKVKSLFGDIQTRAKSGMETGAKMVEEFGEFARGNVDALMASGRAAAKGAETLGNDAASYGRKSLESATAAFRGFAAAKSPTELFKLQSEFAKSSFEEAMAEGSRFSETMLKLVGEITQPLSTRVAVAAEKIKAPNA